MSHDVSCKAISLVEISQLLIRKSSAVIRISCYHHFLATLGGDISIRSSVDFQATSTLLEVSSLWGAEGSHIDSKTDLSNLSIPGFLDLLRV